MKFYIADAFTEQTFGGNPAGVVILEDGADFPEAETMRKTAAELRYSETAFIKKLDEGVFNVRYFTPADEVDLCGHATIASFHCLREAGLVQPGQCVTNKTLAGDLNIIIGPNSILMDMATPEYLGEISAPDAMKELYGVMGLDWEVNAKALEAQCLACGGDGSGLKPEMISTGLPDILLPVANREQLAAISPDFPALTELSRKYNVVGVHAYTLDGGKHRIGIDCSTGADQAGAAGGAVEAEQLGDSGCAGGAEFADSNPMVDAYCRNFAPLYDIDEEAATGTSNGALTYGLVRNGVVQLSHSCDMLTGVCGMSADCMFVQGEAMDRPSVITSKVSPAVKIQVGGNAVILAEGEIHI